jgi:hypothetical protein
MEKNGLLVDYTSCELSASQGSEPVAVSSAQSAVRKFEEGLAALEAVGNPQRYEAVHTVLSTEPSFRYKGMPKDAFHVACMSDIARVRNGLSRMGLSKEDKAIAHKRIAVMNGAQNAYLLLQSKSIPAI